MKGHTKQKLQIFSSAWRLWENVKSRSIDGLFILHYAKLGLLELYYTFWYKYCDEIFFEERGTGVEYRLVALAEEKLEDC